MMDKQAVRSLGGKAKSAEIREQYNQNPNKCLHCGEAILVHGEGRRMGEIRKNFVIVVALVSIIMSLVNSQRGNQNYISVLDVALNYKFRTIQENLLSRMLDCNQTRIRT